jgi:hypothetical protein
MEARGTRVALHSCMRILDDVAAVTEALVAAVLRGALVFVPALLLMGLAMPATGCSKEKAYIAALRADLRGLVALQEERRAQGLPVLEQTPTSGSWLLSVGVTLVSMSPTADGFVAVVAYPAGTAKTCEVRHRWGAEPAPRCK